MLREAVSRAPPLSFVVIGQPFAHAGVHGEPEFRLSVLLPPSLLPPRSPYIEREREDCGITLVSLLQDRPSVLSRQELLVRRDI